MVDDLEIVIDKDWQDVPYNLIENAWNAAVGIQINVIDYTSGEYVPFNASHGNNGNITYTDNTTSTGSVDANGVVTVQRTNVYNNDINNDKYCVKINNLPKFDAYGHLNKYTI